MGYVENFIIFLFKIFNFLMIKVGIKNEFINFLFFFTLLTYLNVKYFFKLIKPEKFLKLYILLNWPGTVIHELAHLIGAILTGNKIKEINLKPKIEETEKTYNIRMGYIKYESLYPGSGAIASIFPFFFIPFLFFYGYYFLLKFHINEIIIMIYLFFSFLFFFPSMMLSKEDWLSFFNSVFKPLGFLQFILFWGLLFYFFSKIEMKYDIIFLLKNGFYLYLKVISIFLVINIGIRIIFFLR